jgi:two-component system NtrC family response regulator
VLTVELPPLRDRGGDIALLARHFLERASGSRGRHLTGFAADAIARLSSYGWPGNVRELRNVIERATILATGTELTAADLRLDGGATAGAGLGPLLALPFQDAKKKFERAYLEAALKDAGGNISQAAQRTGIDRNNLKDKMKVYGLKGKDDKG